MSAIQEEKKTDNELIVPMSEFNKLLDFMPEYNRPTGGGETTTIDWNTLMPVVEKIERLKVKVYQDAVVKDGTMADVQFKRGRNNSYVCIISYFEHDGGKHKHSRSYTGRIVVEAGTRILSVYKAVLAFIDWYNSQTIKK